MDITDIRIYLTGGAGNTDPNLSLGGVTSSTEFVSDSLNNLFGAATASQAENGAVQYRALAVKNTHVSDTWTAMKMWLSQLAKKADASDYTAYASFALGLDATTGDIPNDTTAPSGVTFTSPTTRSGGISCSDLAPAVEKRIWVRRTIVAGAVYDSAVNHRITYGGERSA